MKPIHIRTAASQYRGAKVAANIRKGDALADALVIQVAPFLPGAEREHRFHATRMWRFDIGWPALRLAVEIEGGAWGGGAHTRGAHFRSDCEKYAEAACLGWRVLRVMPEHVSNGAAAGWLLRIVPPAP